VFCEKECTCTGSLTGEVGCAHYSIAKVVLELTIQLCNALKLTLEFFLGDMHVIF
jgi:hypothetical protein